MIVFFTMFVVLLTINLFITLKVTHKKVPQDRNNI